MEENSTKKTETKQSWFKSHMAICIICAVVVIAAIVGIVLIMGKNGEQSPEQVVETYVAAMQEGDVDKLMSVTDLKGAYVWEVCEQDADKFEEEYKKVSNEDAKSYEETTKASLESAMSMLKAFGGVEMTINKIEKPEELANGLYKVKASVKMKVSVFGMEQEEDQDMILVTYNGKYIGEASE